MIKKKTYSRERVIIYAKSYQLFVEKEHPTEEEKKQWFIDNVK